MEHVISQPVGLFAGVRTNLLRGLRRWYHERRMTRALESLPDKMLKDIGVARCEIPWIAHTTYADED